MTDVRRDSRRTDVREDSRSTDDRRHFKRTDGRMDPERTSVGVDSKSVRAERLLIRAGLLLMVVFAVYGASHMGWIRTSLFD